MFYWFWSTFLHMSLFLQIVEAFCFLCVIFGLGTMAFIVYKWIQESHDKTSDADNIIVALDKSAESLTSSDEED